MKNLKEAVREYYGERELDGAALARLMTDRPRRSNRRRNWAIAATVAATVVALGLLLGGRALFAPTPEGETGKTAPRLVAVQIRADWCARTPEVAPLFSELLATYGNEPVLFVTLDITDDTRREQAELLSFSLGIPQAFDEPFESGMIKLIDRENRVMLAAITGREQAGEFETRIVEALDVLDDVPRENDRSGV